MGGSISIKTSVKYLRLNMWRRAGGGRRCREKIGENYTALHISLQLKKHKEREPTKIGWEPGLKGMGSGKFKPSAPPPRVFEPRGRTPPLMSAPPPPAQP